LLGLGQPHLGQMHQLVSELGLNLRGENDEDILGPCGSWFDLEAHISPMEYGYISRSTGATIGVSE
jgi:hypothetical protein